MSLEREIGKPQEGYMAKSNNNILYSTSYRSHRATGEKSVVSYKLTHTGGQK